MTMLNTLRLERKKTVTRVHMRFKDSPRKGWKGGSSWLEGLKLKSLWNDKGIWNNRHLVSSRPMLDNGCIC